MTPEGKVKKEVKAFLDSLGEDCWYYMPIPMGYGKRGVPDFIICYKGFFLAPETKRDGGKGKAWQDREQEAIRKAKGQSDRCVSVRMIQGWVKWIDAGAPGFNAL